MNLYRNSVLKSMKISLFAAARINDVDVLHEYMRPRIMSIVLKKARGGVNQILGLRDASSRYASLLHLAAEAGHVAFVRELLKYAREAGCVRQVVCATDLDGYTALHRVVPYGDARMDIVELLVAADIEVLSVRARSTSVADGSALTPTMLIDELRSQDPNYDAHSMRIRTRIVQIHAQESEKMEFARQAEEKRMRQERLNRKKQRDKEREQLQHENESQVSSSRPSSPAGSVNSTISYGPAVRRMSLSSSPMPQADENPASNNATGPVHVNTTAIKIVRSSILSPLETPATPTSVQESSINNNSSTQAGIQSQGRRRSILSSATRSTFDPAHSSAVLISSPHPQSRSSLTGVGNCDGVAAGVAAVGSPDRRLSSSVASPQPPAQAQQAESTQFQASPVRGQHVSAAFERHVGAIDRALTGFITELQEFSDDSDGDAVDYYDSTHHRHTPITNRMLLKQQQKSQPQQSAQQPNLFASVAFSNVRISDVPLSAQAFTSPSNKSATAKRTKTAAEHQLQQQLTAVMRPGGMRVPTRKARKTEQQECAAVFAAFKYQQDQEEGEEIEFEGHEGEDGLQGAEEDGELVAMHGRSHRPSGPWQAVFQRTAQGILRRARSPSPMSPSPTSSSAPSSPPKSPFRSSSPGLGLGRTTPSPTTTPTNTVPAIPSISMRKSSIHHADTAESIQTAKRSSIYKNEYGEWVVASDCFGRTFSSPHDSHQRPVQVGDGEVDYEALLTGPNSSTASTSVLDMESLELARLINISTPKPQTGTNFNSFRGSKEDSTGSTVRGEGETGNNSTVPFRIRVQQQLEQRNREMISRFQPAAHQQPPQQPDSTDPVLKPRQQRRSSSVLQRKFNEVFDSSARNVPSIFEHFKEYIDPHGNFDMDKINESAMPQVTSQYDEYKAVMPEPEAAINLQEISSHLGNSDDSDIEESSIEDDDDDPRNILNWTSEADIAPIVHEKMMAAFEPDADKRREQRRQQIMQAREKQANAISVQRLNKPLKQTLAPAVQRLKNSQDMQTDLEVCARIIACLNIRIDY
jgi:hypothetical protein